MLFTITIIINNITLLFILDPLRRPQPESIIPPYVYAHCISSWDSVDSTTILIILLCRVVIQRAATTFCALVLHFRNSFLAHRIVDLFKVQKSIQDDSNRLLLFSSSSSPSVFICSFVYLSSHKAPDWAVGIICNPRWNTRLRRSTVLSILFHILFFSLFLFLFSSWNEKKKEEEREREM